MDDELDFLDSNVWLYTLITGQDPRKHALAMELVRNSNIRISTQVVGEVCNALIRKTKTPESKIKTLIGDFYERYQSIEIHRPEQLVHASDLREQYRFSHWDSLIVVAALESGCTTLYSEDMHDGLVVEGTLTIKNPFRGA